MKKIITFILVACFLSLLKPISSLAYSNSEIITAVNNTRQQNSLSTLTGNKQLDKAAAAKLADIQKYQYWDHNNPTTQATWVSFIRQAGFNGAAGENLAKGFSSADKIIIAWLNSPTHKANLLSPNFNLVGSAIGEVNYSTGPQTVVVLTFGQSKPNIFTTFRSKTVSFFHNLFQKQLTTLL